MQMNAIDRAASPLLRVRALAAAVLLGAALGAAAAPTGAEPGDKPRNCGGDLHNHYGPFDYRHTRGPTLSLVEDSHFTPGVESLTEPVSTSLKTIAGDIGYTLRAFPNHHRALLAMMRLGEQRKTDFPPSAGYTVECYFMRAVRFTPDDTVVRGLYAQYLIKRNRNDDAMRQMEAAAHYAGDNPLSHYNIGLIYFDLGRYDRALEEAHKAQALGFERSDLAQKLKRIGKWQELAVDATRSEATGTAVGDRR